MIKRTSGQKHAQSSINHIHQQMHTIGLENVRKLEKLPHFRHQRAIFRKVSNEKEYRHQYISGKYSAKY